jgi:DNA-binding CsgD family transcriptional regulator/predicted transcriptional regulator
LKIKHLIKNSFKTTSPHAGIESIEKSLRDNSFLVVIDSGSFLGILTPSDIIESPYRLVIDCLHDKPRVDLEQDIESVLILMKKSRTPVLPVFDGVKFVGVITQAVITDYLFEYRKELERKISEHTVELTEAYKKIRREIIEERKQAEEVIRERNKELDLYNKNLEEANIALKVLLKRRDEDKAELEDRILLNMKALSTPYLEKLKMTVLDENQKTYLSMLESNLNDLLSPFSHKLSSMFLDFTPTEIQVANLLRQGKTSKEIGELFHCTPSTIAFHRNNIRKKLRLKNKKANLKSYLISLQKD